jgi:hypothetical protein
VIFICSVWPMLINTAFGVAGVRREWLNVARTLEVNPLRKAFEVILPAAAPTILTGMRISMGIAWLVIVAAEMLVGGTGIGYFVWNEWNNLSLTNVIFAILVIGVVGMLLDLMFARAAEVPSPMSTEFPARSKGLSKTYRRRRRTGVRRVNFAGPRASSSASSATGLRQDHHPERAGGAGDRPPAAMCSWTGARWPAPAWSAAWCSRAMR